MKMLRVRKTFMIWFLLLVPQLTPLCKGLVCERSISTTGERPVRHLEQKSCLPYKEFQNQLTTIVDKARGKLPANVDMRFARVQKNEIDQSNSTIACITFDLHAIASHDKVNETVNIAIRDCLVLTNDTLKHLQSLPVNCKTAVDLENNGPHSIRGSRYLCVCTENDCNRSVAKKKTLEFARKFEGGRVNKPG